MGYVTKTITEYVGEVSASTSYHFESFEDFKEYEKNLGVEYAVSQDYQKHPVDIIIEQEDENEWIPNPGYQPVGDFVRVDTKWSDGEVEENEYAVEYGWSSEITHYKLSKKEKTIED